MYNASFSLSSAERKIKQLQEKKTTTEGATSDLQRTIADQATLIKKLQRKLLLVSKVT